MLKSKFFCLFFSKSKKNILNFSYDISFSYSLKNIFFRNINNRGGVYSDGKYTINLSGKGFLDSFNESELCFFSSEFFIPCFDQQREFFVTFNEGDDYKLFFEQAWSLFFKNESLSVVEQKRMGFPILKVCLVSKIIKDSSWSLELIEK